MIIHLIKCSDVVSNSHVFEKWWRLIPRISITHDRYEIRRKCTQLSVDNQEIQFYFSSVTNFNFLHIRHDTDLLMNYDENWKIEILSNTWWEDEYLSQHRYCDNVSSEHVTDFFSIRKKLYNNFVIDQRHMRSVIDQNNSKYGCEYRILIRSVTIVDSVVYSKTTISFDDEVRSTLSHWAQIRIGQIHLTETTVINK